MVNLLWLRLAALSIFNRLYDFRWTAKRHKLRDLRDVAKSDTEDYAKYDREAKALYKTTHRMGLWTWGLLNSQILFFFLGGVFITYFWIANYTGKL